MLVAGTSKQRINLNTKSKVFIRPRKQEGIVLLFISVRIYAFIPGLANCIVCLMDVRNSTIFKSFVHINSH